MRPSTACFWEQERGIRLRATRATMTHRLYRQFDAEGQMARFVIKTLRVCSGLVVLTYCT